MSKIRPMTYIEKLLKNRQRDKRIIDQRKRGMRPADIARKHNTSRQLVNIILKKAGLVGKDRAA